MSSYGSPVGLTRFDSQVTMLVWLYAGIFHGDSMVGGSDVTPGANGTTVTNAAIQAAPYGIVLIKQNCGPITGIVNKAGVQVMYEGSGVVIGTDTVSRDSKNRFLSVAGQVPFSITRDAAGRIATRTVTLGNTITTVSTYNRDSSGKITSVVTA